MEKITFILCESWNWAIENLENDVLRSGKHDTYGNDTCGAVGKVTDHNDVDKPHNR
jgi:hypothetical protein